MGRENFLYGAVFTLFLGFLTFLSPIINETEKLFAYSEFIHSYFVLFLLGGIILTIIGAMLAIVWNFNNRRPYYELSKRRNYYFHWFLSAGVFFVIIGFMAMHYIFPDDRNFYNVSIGTSVFGIGFLVLGLLFFVKEVFLAKKIPLRS